MIEAVKKEFDRRNISIPYPQRDVHMHTVGPAA
jgi:small-conductance mechanosensitive channel